MDGTVKELVRISEWLASTRQIARTWWRWCPTCSRYPDHLPSRVARSTPSPGKTACVDASLVDGRVCLDVAPPSRAAPGPRARERVYFKTDSHWNFNG